MVTLYKHNQAAYEAASEMMLETGRAAVIHPTGTGKSFIGFKLCEDNPDKTVLWLSPSEYIFQTQIENLKATGAEVPGNIVYLTYAKLMNMDEESIQAINPSLEVWDEFHRAGAAQWQTGIARLLRLFPYVPVLGLSATAVRYLDNQRDMSEELFGGNIASEMTLGEAISRGILNPPRYVMAVYSYKKDLERYQKRILSIRNKRQRDSANRILEALRRTLEKADGLDVIFRKYMPAPHGKYIVFCSNKEHMDEMMGHLEWFRSVDECPRVYSVYSQDPAASESFDAFKADKVDDHLRLLYCIDALNEGIHVDGVDGVILLRPTVSPTVYKQQIGRALSASGSGEPVIFDIVNNIAGLYSISAIQDEMREFQQFYQLLGEPGILVNERFQLIEALEDCRELFRELEDTLTASWEFMYEEAKAYYEENGDLLPAADYVTPDRTKLGIWIVTQRTNYRNGAGISPEQIEKLNQIGMSWQTQHERQWEEKYRQAKEYWDAHGDLFPTRRMDAGLAYWIIRQRQKQRDGLLTDEQFDRLSALGMVWEFEAVWEQKFEVAKAYLKEHGDLDIPATYETKDGVRLGSWYRSVRNQYHSGTLKEERKRRLEEIGIQWESVLARNWQQYYELAKQYYRDHGNLNINAHYETEGGVRLGTWISQQRYNRKRGKYISEEQIRLLDEIGMSWHRDKSRWERAYEYAKAYFDAQGGLNPPAGYKAADGFPLGAWVSEQRKKHAVGKLKPMQVRRLEALGITWDVIEDAWQCGLEHARAYYGEHGHLDVKGSYTAKDGYRLGIWIWNQRTRYRDGEMTEEQQKLLEEIGMHWNIQEDRWQEGYAHLAAYNRQHGDSNVPQRYVCDDGYPLGSWTSNQRCMYREGKLTGERIRMLEELGIVWNIQADRWNRGYSFAKAYRRNGGQVPVLLSYVTAEGYPLGEWLHSQERRYKKGVLEADRIERLAEIGIVFDTT